MTSLRDLVGGDDDDDDGDYLAQFALQQAAFLRRKRQQRRTRGQEVFAEDPFTHTDAIKWEEEALQELTAEYPSLNAALVTIEAAAHHRRQQQQQPSVQSSLATSLAPKGAVALKDVSVRLLKLWYPRVWVIPAFTIPEVHFVPLCTEVQMQRSAQAAQDPRAEKLTDALLALRAKSTSHSVNNYDYSEERCLVDVVREPIQPYDEAGDIADRQRVLAWWPEGDRSTMKNGRVAAVMRAIAIERAKQQQWNAHVREQLAGSSYEAAMATAAAVAAIDTSDETTAAGSSSFRRHSLATTGPSLPTAPPTAHATGLTSVQNSPDKRRGSSCAGTTTTTTTTADDAGADAAADAVVAPQAHGDRLYWPALVKRVVGVFEGLDMFEDTPRGLAALQGYEDLGDVIATALTCRMRLCMDVVFAVDEVSECRRLDLSPDVVYTPPQYWAFVQPKSDVTLTAMREALGVRHGAPSQTATAGSAGAARSRQRLAAAQVEEAAQSAEGDDEVMAAVRRAYAGGDGCTVAEANEWVATLRHPQDCPVLTPEALPEVVSIRNLGFTPAEDPPAHPVTSTRSSSSSPTAAAGVTTAAASSQAQARPRGTLNAATLSNSPISLFDLLAGPTCQTRTLVLLRANPAVLSRALREAVCDLAVRWRRLRQALADRLTAYEEEPPVPVPGTPAPASPLLPPSAPLVQLPDTFETPFIESSADRADDLPPEPPAQENMTEEQLRAATSVPRLQSHAPRTLGSVQPADAMPPSPAKQWRPSTRSPSHSNNATRAGDEDGSGLLPRPPHRHSPTRPTTTTTEAATATGTRPTRVGVNAPPARTSAALTPRGQPSVLLDVPSANRGRLSPGARRGPVRDVAAATTANTPCGECDSTKAPSSARDEAQAELGSHENDRRGGPSVATASNNTTVSPSAVAAVVGSTPFTTPLQASLKPPELTSPPAVDRTAVPASSAPSRSSQLTRAGPQRSDGAGKTGDTIHEVDDAEEEEEEEEEDGNGNGGGTAGAIDHEVRLPWEAHSDKPTAVSSPRPPKPLTEFSPPTTTQPSVRPPTSDAPFAATTGLGPLRASAKASKPRKSHKAVSARDAPHHARQDSLPEATETVTPSHSMRGKRQSPSPSSSRGPTESTAGSAMRAAPVVVAPPSALSVSSASRKRKGDVEQDSLNVVSPRSRRHRAREGGVVDSTTAATPAPDDDVNTSYEGSARDTSPSPRKSKYVLVRRIVRRDPLGGDAFVPLPSIGTLAREVAAAGREASVEEAATSVNAPSSTQRGDSSPLLTLLRDTGVLGPARRGEDGDDDDDDESAVTLDSPSLQRVHSRTPFHYSLSSRDKNGPFARRPHSTSARISALPIGWNTSPMRSMSFRDSRSHSLLHTTFDSGSPPDPSVSFDVYSLARAAAATTTTTTTTTTPQPLYRPVPVRASGEAHHCDDAHEDAARGDDDSHGNRPSRVRRESGASGRHGGSRTKHHKKHSASTRDDAAQQPAASPSRPRLQGRQAQQNAFYVHVRTPMRSDAADEYSPSPLQPSRQVGQGDGFYSSAAVADTSRGVSGGSAGARAVAAPERFARTDARIKNLTEAAPTMSRK